MSELTIEQKMAYVRKALEMGAKIEVRIHNCLDKEEAIKAAEELSEFIRIPFEEHSYHGTRWYEIRNNYSFDTTIYFEEKYQEEAM